MKLGEAVKAIREVEPSSRVSDDGCKVYEGLVGDDMNWRVGTVPQGGYVLGLIFSALRSAQKNTPHPDPIHLTAHYLASLGDGQYRIEVKVVKRGRAFANLEAKLVQEEKVCVSVHAICGILPPFPSVPSDTSSDLSSPTSPERHFDLLDGPGLLPHSPLARRIPLCHPLAPPPATRLRKAYRPYKFSDDLVSVVDTEFDRRRRAREQYAGLQNQSSSSGANTDGKVILTEVGNGSFEVGEWFTLKDRDEVLDESMVPFFGDMMVNLPDLLPKGMRGGNYWYPTVTLSLSFLYRLPWSSPPNAKSSRGISKRTIGLYSQSRFFTGPSGRHDAYVELWTAPEGCDLDTGSTAVNPSNSSSTLEHPKGGEMDERWKEKMICIATSHQLALTLPMSVNASKGKNGAKM